MMAFRDSESHGKELRVSTRPTRRPPAQNEDEDEEDFSDSLDDRALDLGTDEDSAFLRGQKRVPVRRGPLPKKTANRLKNGLVLLGVFVAVSAAAVFAYRYAISSTRFRLESRESITVTGIENVPREQVLAAFRTDIGRNVLFLPLSERKRQLEEIPWVESATVMRLLPDRLQVDIRERTPVAFAQIGSKVALIDAGGVVMEMPPRAGTKYSFPVILGMGESEPISTRAARMKIYLQLIAALDSGGAQYSRDISEVELSDPEDVKVTVADPQGAVLVHLGDTRFLERYKIYVAHVQEWRQQFRKFASVDLRYDGQVIVNPDAHPPSGGDTAETPKPAPKPSAPAKAPGKPRHR
jgi:cell division protein FtsQ